jgi:hypothetical protein
VRAGRARTLAGPSVRIRVRDGKVYLNNSRTKVVQTDVAATNGTIHVINRVLCPPPVRSLDRRAARMPALPPSSHAHLGPRPASLCDRHLLGEHHELHAIWSILTTAKRLTGAGGPLVAVCAQPEVAVRVELERQPPAVDAVLAQLEQVVHAVDVVAEVELGGHGLGGHVVHRDHRRILPI